MICSCICILVNFPCPLSLWKKRMIIRVWWQPGSVGGNHVIPALTELDVLDTFCTLFLYKKITVYLSEIHCDAFLPLLQIFILATYNLPSPPLLSKLISHVLYSISQVIGENIKQPWAQGQPLRNTTTLPRLILTYSIGCMTLAR